MQFSSEDLLVSPHCVHDRSGREVTDGWQRAELSDDAGDRISVGFVKGTSGKSDVCHGEHAVRHGLSVPESSVAGHSLYRVSYGVSEVQRSAQTTLALVLRDDGRLDPAGLCDDGDKGIRFSREDLGEVLTDPLKEFTARDDAVLDDFVEASAELSPRERLEQLRIGHHDDGLVKRSDQVLAQRVIDADFSTDGAVDLGQECCGDVGELNTP